MLNKTAEKVLKCIIEKFDGNFEETTDISRKDFKNSKITNSLINSICIQLHKEGYLENAYLSYGEDDCVSVYLNHEGYSYFENKRTKLFQTWVPVIISLIALIKSFLPELTWLLQAITKLAK